jgi:hypothetical protein
MRLESDPHASRSSKFGLVPHSAGFPEAAYVGCRTEWPQPDGQAIYPWYCRPRLCFPTGLRAVQPTLSAAHSRDQRRAALNLLLTGALVSYLIRRLRRENPSWTQVSTFAAVGIVLVSGSIFLAKLAKPLNELLAPESILHLLLLTRSRMVPCGAIPLA